MFETADKFIDVKNHKKKLKNVLTICQIHFYLKNYENCLTLISETEKCYSGKNVDTLAMFLIPRVRCLIMMEKYKEGVEVAIAGLKKSMKSKLASTLLKIVKLQPGYR